MALMRIFYVSITDAKTVNEFCAPLIINIPVIAKDQVNAISA
jgi:hypothetical protein